MVCLTMGTLHRGWCDYQLLQTYLHVGSGGHNVISGILDFLERYHPGSKLYGFLKGPKGIMTGNAKEITPEAMVRQ